MRPPRGGVQGGPRPRPAAATGTAGSAAAAAVAEAAQLPAAVGGGRATGRRQRRGWVACGVGTPAAAVVAAGGRTVGAIARREAAAGAPPGRGGVGTAPGGAAASAATGGAGTSRTVGPTGGWVGAAAAEGATAVAAAVAAFATRRRGVAAAGMGWGGAGGGVEREEGGAGAAEAGRGGGPVTSAGPARRWGPPLRRHRREVAWRGCERHHGKVREECHMSREGGGEWELRRAFCPNHPLSVLFLLSLCAHPLLSSAGCKPAAAGGSRGPTLPLPTRRSWGRPLLPREA